MPRSLPTRFPTAASLPVNVEQIVGDLEGQPQLAAVIFYAPFASLAVHRRPAHPVASIRETSLRSFADESFPVSRVIVLRKS